MRKRVALTPAGIDALREGKLDDPLTPGLSIEALPTGRKRWQYRRRIAGGKSVLKVSLGLFPTNTIADARAWARDLNAKVEAGIDPRKEKREQDRRSSMTVARAHELYLQAVKEGRASSAKRPNKNRTIVEKLSLYRRDIEPVIGARNIYTITEDDLIRLVEEKGSKSPVRANRLAAEFGVFFGWASSLRGRVIDLTDNPARRLRDLRFPEKARTRFLDGKEIGIFLLSLSKEDILFRRFFVLLLLTLSRAGELMFAERREIVDGIWTIPGERTKNSIAMKIPLGPWGQRLMQSDGSRVFTSDVGGARLALRHSARDRIHARMVKISKHEVQHFTLHDLRRTGRTLLSAIGISRETAEAMLNHAPPPLVRIYDQHEREEQKREGFLALENEILRIARRAGVAELLGAPEA